MPLDRHESVSTVNSSLSSSSTSGGGRKRPPVFPQKLYDMLENAERDGYSHVISWMPDGKSFKIHIDPTSSFQKNKEDEQAIMTILKKTFNQTRYKSFLRQIQLYGFQRIYKGPRKGECSHELFVRGQRDLLYRKSIEDWQSKSSNSIESKGRNQSRSPKRTVPREVLSGVMDGVAMPPPPPMTPLLREVTREITGGDKADEKANENKNDGESESDFALPRPEFCGSGPSPDNIESGFAWPRPEACGSIPSLKNIRCSSSRASQCQYLRTSEIPTQLRNLVLTDSSDDEDDVEQKSTRNNIDRSYRRSSSILSLAMSEEFGLEQERKRRSSSIHSSKRSSMRSSIRSSILSLAMSEDFGLELENSMSKLSLCPDHSMSKLSLGPDFSEFDLELDCEEDDDAGAISIKLDSESPTQILPQAA